MAEGQRRLPPQGPSRWAFIAQTEAEAWLSTVYDIAAPALKSAQWDQDPPTVVRQSQEAISWLSRAMLELDRDSAESATALAQALSRLLVVWVFANEAQAGRPGDQ